MEFYVRKKQFIMKNNLRMKKKSLFVHSCFNTFGIKKKRFFEKKYHFWGIFIVRFYETRPTPISRVRDLLNYVIA